MNISTLHAAPSADLVAGDLAVIEFNIDTHPEVIKLVALTNIAAGEIITITDHGWDESALFNHDLEDVEGRFEWETSSGGIQAGTVITFEIETGTNRVLMNPAYGSVISVHGWTSTETTASPFGFFGEHPLLGMIGGDQIFIYQGTEASPTMIYGFNASTDASLDVWSTVENGHMGEAHQHQSEKPDGVSHNKTAPYNGVNFGGANFEPYLAYKDTALTTGTKEQLLASLSDPANWDKSRSTAQHAPTSFVVDALDSSTPPDTPAPTALPYAEEPLLEYSLFMPAIMR